MAEGKRRLIEAAKARVEQILEERIAEEGMTLDEIAPPEHRRSRITPEAAPLPTI
jgi:hypothetical protein